MTTRLRERNGDAGKSLTPCAGIANVAARNCALDTPRSP
jgi:hypothetical protein